MRLLVTRPDPDNARTAAALRARGHDVVLAPLLRIATIAAPFGAGPWGGVVLTSANAARALAAHPRCAELTALPAFVVGHRTGEAARAAGFLTVTSADGDADDLVRLLRQRAGAVRLVYLAGADQATGLAAALDAGGIKVDTVVVYRAAAVDRLPDDATAALAAGTIDGILHYSPRTAAAFVAVVPNLSAALALPQFCLSAEVAKPLAAAGARDLRIASCPEEAALLALVGQGSR
jgi:uroporphyrinogen-III synthase